MLGTVSLTGRLVEAAGEARKALLAIGLKHFGGFPDGFGIAIAFTESNLAHCRK